MTDDGIKKLTDETFQEGTSKGVVLVDFHADWCGPCRMLAPVLEKVAKEMHGKATLAKVDIDQSQGVAANYQVTSVPTLILFNEGKEAGRLVGLRDAESIKEFIGSAGG